jgi:hypothetical protein
MGCGRSVDCVCICPLGGMTLNLRILCFLGSYKVPRTQATEVPVVNGRRPCRVSPDVPPFRMLSTNVFPRLAGGGHTHKISPEVI